MAKSKKTPEQKVSQFVSLVDNMINCEYTSKQLKTIRNQINRLEKELNLSDQKAKAQPTNITPKLPEELNEKKALYDIYLRFIRGQVKDQLDSIEFVDTEPTKEAVIVEGSNNNPAEDPDSPNTH